MCDIRKEKKGRQSPATSFRRKRKKEISFQLKIYSRRNGTRKKERKKEANKEGKTHQNA